MNAPRCLSDSSEFVDEADVRNLVSLLGEVVGMNDDLGGKRRRVMDGLCALVDADAWAWSLVHMELGRAPMQVAMLHGGISEAQFVHYVEALEHPRAQEVLGSYVVEAIERGTPLTRRDGEILPDHIPDYDACVDGKWRRAGLGSFMLTAWPLRKGGFSGIGLYRTAGRQVFSARDSCLAHIVLTEVPWLHEEGWGSESGRTLAGLPKRQREILQLLAQGNSRKEIACDLGLSLNTVHGHVRDIYRHFKVNSHAGLMRHFGLGAGDEPPAGGFHDQEP
ncbi:helix-turn-helix transcriptional regulator [Haloferula sargassicola]|uniref:HTH luxR-type domain-containing protein n=1 Tax=Haloferula sargassicola TaxID=490096 RepID=A0ABP9USL3_9BACT